MWFMVEKYQESTGIIHLVDINLIVLTLTVTHLDGLDLCVSVNYTIKQILKDSHQYRVFKFLVWG